MDGNAPHSGHETVFEEKEDVEDDRGVLYGQSGGDANDSGAREENCLRATRQIAAYGKTEEKAASKEQLLPLILHSLYNLQNNPAYSFFFEQPR